MRLILCATALVGLTACAGSVPDSAAHLGDKPVPDTGSGVGFGSAADYLAQQRARDAALEATALPPAGVISPESSATAAANTGPLTATRPTAPRTQGTITSSSSSSPAARVASQANSQVQNGGVYTPTGGLPTAATSEDIARETAARLAETAARLAETSQNSGREVLHASPSNPAPQTVTTVGGISNENSFDAVGNVRSIEDDAQLIAQNRAQYQVVQPGALPQRNGNAGPNIVQYALSTRHQVGEKLYTRVGLNKRAKFERNCAQYASPDLAQSDFLAQGGPRRDKLGLDPDGDGFACGWDPRPFRSAVNN